MSKKKNMYKLESLARLISGRTPEREQKEYYAESGTPWVKIENLDQGYIREASEYLSEQGKEKVNLVPENSVLFSIVGTVGKVGIAGRELATNQQIVSLIFDETRVLPLYGYYALREKEMVFGVFCNGRGGVFEYQGTGRRTGVSVSESICFAQQGVEGTGACGGGV